MEIVKPQAEPIEGRSDWFSGVAYMTNFKLPTPTNNLAIGSVTFTPSARTFWHSHPFGQTLIVTEGVGLVGRRGAAAEEIRPGDVVVIEPNEHHWHGACVDQSMTHIHVNGVGEDGMYATFFEPVSEEDYLGKISNY